MGYRFMVTPGPPWWSAVPKEEWLEGLETDIKPLWKEPHGDRQVEIVCIGQAMDKDCVEAALRACLLTDEELAAESTWSSMLDPFLEIEPATDSVQATQDEALHPQQPEARLVASPGDTQELSSSGKTSREEKDAADTSELGTTEELAEADTANAITHKLDGADAEKERFRKQAEFLKSL